MQAGVDALVEPIKQALALANRIQDTSYSLGYPSASGYGWRARSRLADYVIATLGGELLSVLGYAHEHMRAPLVVDAQHPAPPPRRTLSQQLEEQAQQDAERAAAQADREAPAPAPAPPFVVAGGTLRDGLAAIDAAQ